MPKARYTDVMVDLETLGTTADSVIMSIGAVKFNPSNGAIDSAAFYASVSIDSNLELGRKINEATLIWWMQQSPGSQNVFHEPKQTLVAALRAFGDWWGTDNKMLIWSNGADFDIPMMAHAMQHSRIATPWQFFNARCYRTVKNTKAAKCVPRPDNPNAHNALADAIYQAKHLCSIFAATKELA